MLKKDNALLVFIDVQGKLSERVDGSETLFSNLHRLLQGMNTLGVPVIVTEQIPEKLGPTREEFQAFISDPAISKSSFSCCGEPKFMEAFASFQKRQAILIGIETHVCVYQTALDLLEEGIEVFVVADAVSSRSPENKQLALQAMRDAGVKIIPTEAVLFALLRDAADPHFKELLGLIK